MCCWLCMPLEVNDVGFTVFFFALDPEWHLEMAISMILVQV